MLTRTARVSTILLAVIALSGCGSKTVQSTATAARGLDAETQKVLSNPNASPADKQQAIARIKSNTQLVDSEKNTYIERLSH